MSRDISETEDLRPRGRPAKKNNLPSHAQEQEKLTVITENDLIRQQLELIIHNQQAIYNLLLANGFKVPEENKEE